GRAAPILPTLGFPKARHLAPAHVRQQSFVAAGNAVEKGRRILLLHADAAVRVDAAEASVAPGQRAVEGNARATPVVVVEVDIHGVDHAGRRVAAAVAPLALVERKDTGRGRPRERVAAIVAARRYR